jgi:hypothetical protein
MMIDNYFKKISAGIHSVEPAEEISSDSEDERQTQPEDTFEHNQKRFNSKKKTFEVDYDYFRDNFWDLVKSAFYYRKISCHLVWTEIHSVIKVSIYSGVAGLSIEQYNRYGNQSLSQDQKNAIY